VSAPIRDFRGAVIAALNVSAPKFRMAADLAATGESMRAAGDELSRQLGWAGEETPADSGDPASITAALAAVIPG
jgi:IclR family transcriptional regulator, KDG regulon repressor